MRAIATTEVALQSVISKRTNAELKADSDMFDQPGLPEIIFIIAICNSKSVLQETQHMLEVPWCKKKVFHVFFRLQSTSRCYINTVKASDDAKIQRQMHTARFKKQAIGTARCHPKPRPQHDHGCIII